MLIGGVEDGICLRSLRASGPGSLGLSQNQLRHVLVSLNLDKNISATRTDILLSGWITGKGLLSVNFGSSPGSLRNWFRHSSPEKIVQIKISRQAKDFIWGGLRDSNPRSPPPQGGALPTKLNPPSRQHDAVRLYFTSK